MDLVAEAQRLRLDALAVAVSARLTSAGLPHALLKGPSTALWLYRPPRGYRDVDVLVPRSRLDEVVARLSSDGLARPAAGQVGEEAEHSLLMLSAEGFELDLHVSLPAVPPAGDRVWDALAGHTCDLDLGVGTVRALDEAGRCLVLALHALADAGSPQPVEDLRRARADASSRSWRRAGELADAIGAADLFRAGLAVVEPDAPGTRSPRAQLFLHRAPSSAHGLQRIAELPLRHRPAAVWREVVPSRGFMQRADPGALTGHAPLLRAHLRRWRRLLRGLPAAVAAWRDARQ